MGTILGGHVASESEDSEARSQCVRGRRKVKEKGVTDESDGVGSALCNLTKAEANVVMIATVE